MKCRRVQKWLPLYVGQDLGSRKTAGIRRHLEECRVCRAEHDAYEASFRNAREWLSQFSLDWEEAHWKNTLRKAVRLRMAQPLKLAPWPFPRPLAWLSMAAVVILFGILFIKPGAVSRITGISPSGVIESRTQPIWALEEKTVQDVVSMTMVSQESGLKIVWFFNKNFELEVD